MNILGINFTKIHAERIQEAKQASINTNIEFTDVEKEKLEILKDAEAVRINYTFSIIYNQGEGKKQDKVAEIAIEGTILLSATSEESKDLFKAWKKEELPPQFKIPLFNVLLKKCSVKALSLEEDLGIPLHVPFPKIQPKPQE